MNMLGSCAKRSLACFSSVRWFSNETTSLKDTVRKGEVEKFSGHAKLWWDLDGPMGGLHAFNKIRVPFIRKCMLDDKSVKSSSRPLEDFKLIDVGCGAGILTEALARIGIDSTGLDASEDLIEVARHHCSLDKSLHGHLNYFNSTIEAHAVDNASSYDGLVCSEVIEHVDNQKFFLEQCVKLVKPGGSLVFTTINRNLLAKLVMINLCENITNVIPKGTHQYEMFVTPKELQEMFESNNCEIRNTKGWMILSKRKVVRFPKVIMYAMHAVKK